MGSHELLVASSIQPDVTTVLISIIATAVAIQFVLLRIIAVSFYYINLLIAVSD
jgi:hypothetical protein